MKRALEIMRCGAYMAAIFLCVSLGVTAIHADRAITNASTAAAATTKKLDGALDETRKTMYTLNVASAEAGKAAIQERKYFGEELPRLGLKAEATFDNTNAVLNSLYNNSEALKANQNAITAQATETLKSANEEIRNLRPFEDDAAKSMRDIDAVVSDPHIKQTLDSMAVTTKNIAATSQDVKEEVHSITHPSAITRTFDWILKVGGALGNWIHF